MHKALGEPFTVYPAIDLHTGQVERLRQGLLEEKTIYGRDPAAAAQRWLEAGARWLHVVNLDGAFDREGKENWQAIAAIIKTAHAYRASIQLGGGLRSEEMLQSALDLGASRLVVGTLIIEQPEKAAELVQRFGAERIAAGIDARDGQVQSHGWQQSSGLEAARLVSQLESAGLRWVIYTDIARDGMNSGLNLAASVEIAKNSQISLIASGGVHSLQDILDCQHAGLAGVIIGRALYDGQLQLESIFQALKEDREQGIC